MTNEYDKFQNFLASFSASRVLLQRAHKEGFFIEGMMLYASLIDGFLRIAIILKTQLENGDAEVEDIFIHQGEGGDFLTERKVIATALEKGIISEKLAKKINGLYDERNKIVHRFFLTHIQYNSLAPHLIDYELTYHELWKIVYELEAEQIQTGVGMTTSGPALTKDDEERIFENLTKKIDNKAT